jgi:hypothetical protein
MKTNKTKRFGTKTRRTKTRRKRFTRKGGMMRRFFRTSEKKPLIYNELVEIIQNFRKLLICTVNDRSIMDRFKKYVEIISHYIDDEDENIKNFLISDIHQVAEIISENNPEEKYQKFEFEKETKILKFNRKIKNPLFSSTRVLNLYNNLPEDQFKILLDSGSISHGDLDKYDRNIRRPIRENEWSCELEYLEKIRNFNNKICLELCDTAKIHELLNESINESDLVELYKKIEKEYFEKSTDDAKSVPKSVPINFEEVSDDDLDYIVGVGVEEEREKRKREKRNQR